VATSDTICRAIRTRYTLSFTYKGTDRLAEPYILGYEASGVLILSAVQVSGGSGSGFRTFLVADMSLVVETERKFMGKHPAYNPHDRLFAHVLCQL
jgi:hypothetical protein